MANVSPATLTGVLTPRVFRFQDRSAVNYQIIFYSDAVGDVPLDVSAGGSVDLVFETRYAASDDDGPVLTEFSAWDPNGSTTGLPGSTLQGFGLGGGAGQLRITPSNLTPAAGAVSYRLHVPASTEVT